MDVRFPVVQKIKQYHIHPISINKIYEKQTGRHTMEATRLCKTGEKTFRQTDELFSARIFFNRINSGSFL